MTVLAKWDLTKITFLNTTKRSDINKISEQGL